MEFVADKIILGLVLSQNLGLRLSVIITRMPHTFQSSGSGAVGTDYAALPASPSAQNK
jgi:hypothetical protein